MKDNRDSDQDFAANTARTTCLIIQPIKKKFLNKGKIPTKSCKTKLDSLPYQEGAPRLRQRLSPDRRSDLVGGG